VSARDPKLSPSYANIPFVASTDPGPDLVRIIVEKSPRSGPRKASRRQVRYLQITPRHAFRHAFERGLLSDFDLKARSSKGGNSFGRWCRLEMPKTTDRRSFGCGIPFARSSPRAEVTMNDHAALKQKAALVSIVVSVLLTSGKLAAGLASGSLALLSEAANNLADVATTIITYWAIRVANKPADDNHQFGHGKV
jgi:uncharacterized membrane protein